MIKTFTDGKQTIHAIVFDMNDGVKNLRQLFHFHNFKIRFDLCDEGLPWEDQNLLNFMKQWRFLRVGCPNSAKYHNLRFRNMVYFTPNGFLCQESWKSFQSRYNGFTESESIDPLLPDMDSPIPFDNLSKELNNVFTPKNEEQPDPLAKQVGGGHYKEFTIQPVEFITANNIGFIEGNVIKYVCRHEHKNGRQDIEKAIHYLELLLTIKYKEVEP